MKSLLSVPDAQLIAVESRLALYLKNGEDSASMSHQIEKPKSNSWRYAKIGAASLGAGAVLAVTGTGSLFIKTQLFTLYQSEKS
jgi:hypothetical protein